MITAHAFTLSLALVSGIMGVILVGLSALKELIGLHYALIALGVSISSSSSSDHIPAVKKLLLDDKATDYG